MSVQVIGYQANSEMANHALKSADVVYARGNFAARWAGEMGVNEPLVVSIGAGDGSFSKIGEQIAEDYGNGKSIVYVTLTNPLAVDILVKNLIEKEPKIKLEWITGDSSIISSEMIAISQKQFGITILDGQEIFDLHHLPFALSQPALIYYPSEGAGLDPIIRLLAAAYPKEHPVKILIENEKGLLGWNEERVSELGAVNSPVQAMLVPPRSADASLESFEEVIARLRAPNGCPWDRKQTHESLRTYLLEETYEALKALDDGDMEGLKEELGDLVLQIALHTQIGAESGEFNMADVLEGINRKIIRRHPHVFGEVKVDDEKGVLQNWETLKLQEREENGTDETKGLLDGIPISFPALAQAQSIQDRAARVGFDWKEIKPVMDKVMEEYEEVQNAPDENERAKELGDLLFAVVNLVRWYHVDAESSLRATNLKFRKRFAYIEQKSRETGKSMQKMTLSEMDVFWNEAKKLE